MTKAIRIHQTGGPEVMQFEAFEPGEPGEGQVQVRHTAIGLNFLDVYYRSGLYPAPSTPFTPGTEAAGVVLKVGPGVSGLKEGDRVAYGTSPIGAYAETRNLPAATVVKLPDGIADEQAAAMMLKGMTAEYLLRRTFKVEKGTTILFHAAAGGVGLIAGQWANHLGATVIGTVGSAKKADLARANGYHHVIDYSKENFVERVKEITGGRKCDVVYDSVGKDTFEGSLDCLRPMGLLALFGQSSGPVPPFNLGVLAQKGSLFVTRPTLFTYCATPEQVSASSKALFDVVSRGVVEIKVNQRYALADAAQAHRDLEGRRTTGTTVLVP